MTERTGRSGPRRALTVLVTLVLVVAAVAVGLSLLPYNPPVATSPGALTPEQSEASYADLVAKDTADPSVLPECRSRDVRPTVPQQGVVLLYHAYTSCPNQFGALATKLSEAGYRVLLPRWPEHGVANSDAEPHSVDAQQLADFGMRTTAIALGLDKRTVVGGLSGGATLALWAAEHNAGVQRVVAVAPFLGPTSVPSLLAHATGNAMRYGPNVNVWWDVSLKDADQVPRYSYAKFATRSLAGLMTIGSTLGTTRTSGYVVYVLNAADGSVDPEVVRTLVSRQRDAGNRVTIYEFPASLHAPHEYVDP
ncbi:MAG TPA: alpha/beta fold hydrolase, partial [Lapillicoccus sp.]|nr:alpha/beta fold hydrolase [Lapillicoccus sp.]